MVEREVVTVPCERVAIDIPLKKTTTAIIIRELTLMFSRNGFPGVIISDNGPLFLSKPFKIF